MVTVGICDLSVTVNDEFERIWKDNCLWFEYCGGNQLTNGARIVTFDRDLNNKAVIIFYMR